MCNSLNFASTGSTPPHGYSINTTGFVDSRETRLAISQLDRVVEFYFSHGIAASTQRTYLSAKHCYFQFCCTNKLDPLPASEHRLCQFVAALALEGLAHNTLKGYLSGIRHLHLENHYKNPNINTMARLEQVLKGIKSLQAKTKGNSHPRLSITPELLVRIRQVWVNKPPDPDHNMLWAAALLCFFGFLRAGEITVPSDTAYDEGTHLNFADVAIDSFIDPQVIKVSIKASKTDPFRLGVDIYLGRTQKELCPIAAILPYVPPSERVRARILIQICRRQTSHQNLFCYKDEGSSNSGWSGLHTLFRSQF